MSILTSRIDARSPEFLANTARMRNLVAELHQQLDRVATGGDARARDKHS
ncbi:hypothetical protein B1A_08027, partial [mine drainage metagenome]